ncbi:4Fe-4S dicluster domain-containing protein, partial [Acinetobacter baumannii]
DCTLCVQVCPVGIDIRQGLQAACIACGACIDACNRVMDQLQAPRGLIRLSTPRGLEAGAAQQARWWQSLVRPRVWLYGGLLSLVGLALVVGWL